VALWAAIYAAALATPALLDDADATHAQAAQTMLRTGDWVTLHVDSIRYLEKAPLPYWLAALSFRCFGFNAFAAHLQLALGVLALAWLARAWGRWAFDEATGTLAALMTLTSTGIFLFTRVLIPEVLLSFFLLLTLYATLRALSSTRKRAAALWMYTAWISLALAVLTKGLVAIVLAGGAVLLYLLLTRQLASFGKLKPITGTLCFLAVAAPWHVLAALRNPASASSTHHGFLWFYFVNEHLLRFLGRRLPRDYNKMPFAAYWLSQLAWIFPWSFFAPLLLLGWRHKLAAARQRRTATSLATQSRWLLLSFVALTLVFFSFSTNQEYYTFPVYVPLLLLIAAALIQAQSQVTSHPRMQSVLAACSLANAVVGWLLAAALAYGLWSARGLAFQPDIGSMLAHRSVGNYTLSLSHFFDLTGPSFAALRLPAWLALAAFALGPAAAWRLRVRRRHQAATLTLTASFAVVLVAAHMALVRFQPMLSSVAFAQRVLALEQQHSISPGTQVMIYGDQSFGSSIPFYLDRTVALVDGRSTSLEFGSTFYDAPHLFFTPQQLTSEWGHGPRKLLFVPAEQRTQVEVLLGARARTLYELSGKTLLTDRPLDTQP
jgi:4-amino-4-deoxy-L-arabinose transferase-like glycosyltransferase